jgi:hypothetical protein
MERGERELTDGPPSLQGHPKGVALGIVEIQMLFGTGDVKPLLSMLSGQGPNQAVDKICRRERRALW